MIKHMKLAVFFALVISCPTLNAMSTHILMTKNATVVVTPIYFSNDGAQNWQAAKIKDIPSRAVVRITKITCTGKETCIAVGNIFEKTQSKLLLLVSKDKGESWSRAKIENKSGNLNTASCNNNFCIAGGVVDNIPNHSGTTYLLSSKDYGATWSIVKDNDKSKYDNYLATSACNKNICIVAGGHYSGGFFIKPYVSYTNNQAKSWQHIDLPEIPANTDTNIYKSACNDNGCMLMGDMYRDSKNFLIVSNADGSQWKYLDKLNADMSLPGMYDNSVTADAWFMVGRKGKDIAILRSTDGGMNWSEQTTILNLPNNSRQGYLRSVNCDGLICNAFGLVDKQPLFLNSQDGGISWQYNPNIFDSDAARFWYFEDMYCADNICIEATFNAAYISRDRGMSWVYTDLSSVLSNSSEAPRFYFSKG